MQPYLPREAPNGVERMLAEAVRRLMRQPRGCVALVLRLSDLPPPAPRPHHRRIARALMQDAAQRHDGQVFALGHGDLALLCRLPPDVSPPAALDGLPATLARLLQVDMPDPARLVSLWPLATEAAALHRYVEARLGEARPEAHAPRPAIAAASQSATQAAAPADWLRHQLSAVAPGGGPGAAWRPLYRVVGLSPAVLAEQRRALDAAVAPGGGEPDGDPFLLRHLAAQRDPAVLEALHAALGGGGPLDAALPGAAPLQVALTLHGIASAACTAWIEACRQRGTAPAIEVVACEACADAAGFATARARVRDAGLKLVLSGVSHLTLLLARPWALGADLMLLDWSRRLAELTPDDAASIAAGIAGQGAARTLLARADDEAALRWGLGQGIRRFQGRTVDAMRSIGLLADTLLADTLLTETLAGDILAGDTLADPAGKTRAAA